MKCIPVPLRAIIVAAVIARKKYRSRLLPVMLHLAGWHVVLPHFALLLLLIVQGLL